MQAVTHLAAALVPFHTVQPPTIKQLIKIVGLPSLTTMRVLSLLALVGTAAAFVPSQPSPFGATT